jgi:hypothetical protein
MTVEVDSMIAAVDWASDRDPDAAARLVASCTGLALAGVGATETLRWAAALLERDLDDAVRARLLVAGAFAAVTAGEHWRIIAWADEAAELTRNGDDVVRALASIWQAAPRMVREPDVSVAMMHHARSAAATAQSRLSQGFVEAWSLIEAICTGDGNSVEVSPADASRFGGRDSWGWSGAVQSGAIALAERGELAAALALLAEVSPLDPAQQVRTGYEVMVTALAGEPADARRLAVAFIVDVDRFSDVLWHAELVLALGLCHLREGDAAVALAYFDAAKRAPMFMPFWYALARRFSSSARGHLDDAAAAEASQRSRALTVEGILDDELRADARRTS